MPNLSPAQRAINFGTLTRKHEQDLPAVTCAASSSVSFTLPKSRLLSKISLLLTGTLTVTHASLTSFTAAAFAPFNLIKNVRVEANNNFTPVNLSGIGAAILSYLRSNGAAQDCLTGAVADCAASRRLNKLSTVASSSGTANVYQCYLEIPIALNDRDPVGLILLQNEETVINVTIELEAGSVLLADTTDYTVALGTVTIQPSIETFSIPPKAEAYPDLSILAIRGETFKTIAGAGQIDLNLPVGNTYRRLGIYITDAAGGEADADLSTKFELVMNMADVPIRIHPRILAAKNQLLYNKVLPDGLWVFDFASQGLANYGGTRDMIDTERLTELLFRFTAAGAGQVRAVYELTSKLS
jgi:hypothetical protein